MMFIVLGVLYVTFILPKSQKTDTATTVDDSGGSSNFFSGIFPFLKNKNDGSNTNTENNPDISGYVPPAEGPVKDMILYKVSSMPIAGYGTYYKERFVDVPEKTAEEIEEISTVINNKPTAPETEQVLALRYVDKSNGNIYQTFADKILESKFTNTVILNIHEAFLSNNAQNVIMRFLKSDGKTISTYAGALEKERFADDYISTTELTGSFLPDNITDLSVNDISSKMFYLFNNKDYSVGINANIGGEGKVQVFDSAYSEWLSQYANQNTITITTKAGSGVNGYMYKINPNKKDFEKVIGPLPGLTTLTSPSGNLVLYADDQLNLFIYNLSNKETRKISIKTLPEKCAWSEDDIYLYCAMPREIPSTLLPDSWYQGAVSFSDQIWKIDAETLNTGLIIDPLQTDGGEDIDGIKLTLKDDYLFFINKKDNFLWELKLK